MNGKTLGYAAAFVVLAATAVAVTTDGQGRFLLAWEGRLEGERGVVKTLAPLTFAMPSAGGGAYALVTLTEGEYPPLATVRVYDRNGRELWSVAETTATRAVVTDAGAAALVTVLNPAAGPASGARVELYDANGDRTGDADLAGFPGESACFPGQGKVALLAADIGVVVYDLGRGREDYVADGGLGFAAGPGETLLVLDREDMALWRAGRREWRARHGLYFPRMAVINANASLALVGAHHEVALVSLAEGRVVKVWRCPGDFGVTDLAAAPDFTFFGVGMRTLAGDEAVVWLDGQLGEVKRQDHHVAQPSGVSPAVVVLTGPGRVVAFGQGWRTTLAR